MSNGKKLLKTAVFMAAAGKFIYFENKEKEKVVEEPEEYQETEGIKSCVR